MKQFRKKTLFAIPATIVVLATMSFVTLQNTDTTLVTPIAVAEGRSGPDKQGRDNVTCVALSGGQAKPKLDADTGMPKGVEGGPKFKIGSRLVSCFKGGNGCTRKDCI